MNREGLRLLEPFSDMKTQFQKGNMCVGIAFELVRSGDPNDLVEATNYAERAVKLLRENPNDIFASLALRAHGWSQLHMGNWDEAETSLREAVQLDASRLSTPTHDALHYLVASMFQRGGHNEAIRFALEQTNPETWPTPVPQMCVRARAMVSHLLYGLGDFERAEQIAREMVEKGETYYGPEDLATIEARYALIQTLVAQRKTKQVETQQQLESILPTLRKLSLNGVEAQRAAFAFVVGHLDSPSAEDVQLSLELNTQLLKQPLWPNRRIRNLYAGALVHRHAGDLTTAQKFLREIVQSPASFVWHPAMGDFPFSVLRNAEDLLVETLLESEDNAAAEQVYRDAITRRENAQRPDKYQIIFAKQRLARFLTEHDGEEEARELLQAACSELVSAGECFEWLRKQVDRLGKQVDRLGKQVDR